MFFIKYILIIILKWEKKQILQWETKNSLPIQKQQEKKYFVNEQPASWKRP